MRTSLLSGLVALAFGIACRPAEQSHPVSVVDGLGRTVSLERPARRIVSLAPATTELLFALDAGDRVVGRTRWCDYPAAALQVPSVGDGLNPNIEAVAATRPDLVVMYSTTANATAVEQLARLGIPAVNLPMDRLRDVSASARLLGVLLGDSASVAGQAARFDFTLAHLQAGQRSGGPSVAIVAWDNPPMVIGAGSFLTELITLAGGRNAFGDIALPSATVSIETIASRNPDLLLVATEDSAGSVPAWASRPEWQAVAAVRLRRFGFLRGSEFNRPSFRAPDAVRQLGELFRTAR